MNKIERIVAVAVAFGGLLGFSPVSNAITLTDYVSDVISNHPKVLERVHEYRQAVQDQAIANKGWRPAVDLDLATGEYSTKSPITNQVRRDYNSSRAALTLTQNLFSGFDTTWQGVQTRARAESALYRLYDEADKVGLEATRAYLDALRQRRLVLLAQQNVESHERMLVKIRERNRIFITRRPSSCTRRWATHPGLAKRKPLWRIA